MEKKSKQKQVWEKRTELTTRGSSSNGAAPNGESQFRTLCGKKIFKNDLFEKLKIIFIINYCLISLTKKRIFAYCI